MDLRGLGAFLSAIAGYFSAQAGAQAGQLQGLLMGEELTERRKRMKMAEEAHQEQIATQRLYRQLQEAEEERRKRLFPYQEQTLATQTERGRLELENYRLWSLYQQGVAPSQITDPVLRAQYEPFFNFQMAIRSLDAVRTHEDLQAVLEKLPEDQRGMVEILGRAKLFENQMRQQMMERYLRGADLNLAQGELQLRTAQINFAFNTVLNNIEAEGTNWDKRSPQQKIEAVRKWLKQTGLEDIVPPNFAEMFQNVQSSTARQLAILQAQINWQLQANLKLYDRQLAGTLTVNREAWMSNIVGGALQAWGQQGGFGGVPYGGGTGVAPIGFEIPPPPNFFTTTRDNRGSQLNLSLLNKYVQVPYNVPVPFKVGGQMVMINLGELQGRVSEIYKRLDSPHATINADEISTLITFDAGLHYASAMKGGMRMGWDTALDIAVGRIIPTLRSINLYKNNTNFRKAVDDWVRAYNANRARATAPQQGQGGQQRQGQSLQQGQGRPPQQNRQGGQGGGARPQGGTQRAPTPSITQADIPRGRIGREP